MHQLDRLPIVNPLAEHVRHSLEVVLMVGQLSSLEHLPALSLKHHLLHTLVLVLEVGVLSPLLLKLCFPPQLSHRVVVQLRNYLESHVTNVLSV